MSKYFQIPEWKKNSAVGDIIISFPMEIFFFKLTLSFQVLIPKEKCAEATSAKGKDKRVRKDSKL